jgi:membrane protease YdiL (CAAX protease family)
LSPPIILAEPDRPFWGFAELFVIAALFIPAVFAGGIAVQAASPYLHIDLKLGLPLLIAEFIGYGIVFIALRVLFARHGQPLFESLGWTPQPFKSLPLAELGVLVWLVSILLEIILRTPNVETPFDKLLGDPLSRIAIALFGITVGPIVEELLFRGFMQPVLVDSFGVLPGILVTSVVFGAMHLMQNGFLWQSGVLITLVGFVLGVVRHVSGSTRASAITHIFYNVPSFVLLVIFGGQAGHK